MTASVGLVGLVVRQLRNGRNAASHPVHGMAACGATVRMRACDSAYASVQEARRNTAERVKMPPLIEGHKLLARRRGVWGYDQGASAHTYAYHTRLPTTSIHMSFVKRLRPWSVQRPQALKPRKGTIAAKKNFQDLQVWVGYRFVD